MKKKKIGKILVEKKGEKEKEKKVKNNKRMKEKFKIIFFFSKSRKHINH